MCAYLVCVKPRLALPALRGFRLELAFEQNPIRFPYRGIATAIRSCITSPGPRT